MDEGFIFLYFDFFFPWEFWYQAFFQFRILEIAAYQTVHELLFVEYYRTFRQVRE